MLAKHKVVGSKPITRSTEIPNQFKALSATAKRSSVGPAGGFQVAIAKLAYLVRANADLKREHKARQRGRRSALPSGFGQPSFEGWNYAAAVSASNLPTLALPPEVSAVIIAADNGSAGRKAAYEAAHRLIREGRDARIALPPAGKDFNEALIAREEESARKAVNLSVILLRGPITRR